jgi:hypothetical protein
MHHILRNRLAATAILWRTYIPDIHTYVPIYIHHCFCGGMGLNPLLLRLQVGKLYQPQMTDEEMDNYQYDSCQEKTEVLG